MPNADFSSEPNWFSPPGATIQAASKRMALSLPQLAESLALSIKDTRRLLLGDFPIDAELSISLSEIIGGSSEFWRKRQQEYVDGVRRCAEKFSDAEFDIMAKQLPLKQMQTLGWTSKQTGASAQAFAFFNVRSAEVWKRRYLGRANAVAFRQSDTLKADQKGTLAWLRQAERLSSLVPCDTWNRDGFEKLLTELRGYTRRKSPLKFFPDLVDKCAAHGVAVVFVPTPKGCTASGATFFVNEQKAVMVLSFRFLSDDQFWFSFFHEAGHLVLHDQNALFLEDDSETTLSAETEANQFAANLLVPAIHRPELESLPARSKPIIRFAVKLGVSPGVVVGQMQHERLIQRNQMNSLKRRYSKDELAALH